MQNKIADYQDKMAIALLILSCCCLRIVWLMMVIIYLVIALPFTLLIQPLEKLAPFCACPRCGGGRIAFAMQSIAHFFCYLIRPINSAEEWVDNKIESRILAARLKQTELQNRIANRRSRL